MKRLVVCLLSVPVLALSTAATAENWKLAPGETKTYYDADFTRVDQSSGLIVTRIAEGKANGPYKNWPASKGPILVFALDCAADKWMDLGMDFDGSKGLPEQGPFDVILLSGSVAEVPKALLAQLKTGGRLAAIVGHDPMMRATFVTRTGETSYTTTQPWDTVAPRLANFAEPSRFNF